jgi:Tol biopolymer transport system component
MRIVGLSDRRLHLHTLRSYFPSIAENTDRVVSVQWVHEQKGFPRGPSAIVSARLDGTDMTPLYPPPDSTFLWTPVVSRNGAWIYFSAGPRFAPPEVDVDVWRVRADGTDASNLTPDSDANDAFPDVSADGSRLVFRSGRTGTMEIYVMNTDGSALRRVSNTKGTATMPAISPNGHWLVYTTSHVGHGMKLWIQSLDDPNDEGHLLEPERSALEALDMHPRFSPDSRWVVFTSDRAGFMDEWFLSGLFPQPYGELFAVPVDGSEPAVRLTHDKWEDALPFWGSAPIEKTLTLDSDT